MKYLTTCLPSYTLRIYVIYRDVHSKAIAGHHWQPARTTLAPVFNHLQVGAAGSCAADAAQPNHHNGEEAESHFPCPSLWNEVLRDRRTAAGGRLFPANGISCTSCAQLRREFKISACDVLLYTFWDKGYILGCFGRLPKLCVRYCCTSSYTKGTHG